MSGSSIRKQALREMARERSLSYGEKSPSFSSFREIPSQHEAKENKVEIEKLPPKEIKLNVSSPTADNPVEESSSSQFNVQTLSSFSLHQYKPLGESKKKEEPRSVNTATLWCAARKMIAQEWRKARGVKKQDCRFDRFEKEAASLKERREEEKRKQEQVKIRFEKYKKLLERPLSRIGNKITEEKDNITKENADKFIEDAFENVGRVYNLEWKDTAVDVWIEPWEEKRARQKRGGVHPVVVYFRINNRLGIDFIKFIEDEEVVVQKKRMMERELESSIDKEEMASMSDEEVSQFLDKKLSEMGRVIDVRKFQDNRWIASIEPWEEIKKRRIKEGGKGPVARTQIEINCSEGKFGFVPQTMK